MNGKETLEFYRETVNFPIGENGVLENAYYEARTLKGQLNYFLKKKGLKLDTLANRIAGDPKQLSRYSTGDRTPDRMTVIRIGLGLNLSEDDLNRLLSSAGYADMSPKRKEDAIILGLFDEIRDKLSKCNQLQDYEYHMKINQILTDKGCEKLFNVREY